MSKLCMKIKLRKLFFLFTNLADSEFLYTYVETCVGEYVVVRLFQNLLSNNLNKKLAL